jgi:hypothetical protein
MGDDSVQCGLKGKIDSYINFTKDIVGITLTVESVLGSLTKQNFCSMDFIELSEGVHVYVPRNYSKNMHSLINTEKSKLKFRGDTLVNLCIEYSFHPAFSILHSLLSTHYPGHYRSKEWFKSIITGYESSEPVSNWFW